MFTILIIIVLIIYTLDVVTLSYYHYFCGYEEVMALYFALNFSAICQLSNNDS